MFDIQIAGQSIKVPQSVTLEVWVDEYWTIWDVNNHHAVAMPDGTIEFQKQHHSEPIKLFSYEEAQVFIKECLADSEQQSPFGVHLIKERVRVL